MTYIKDVNIASRDVSGSIQGYLAEII